MSCATCPIQGCRREIDIDPHAAPSGLLCPCPTQARLTLGLSGTSAWVLRPAPYRQDERHEHNLIMHALVTGRGGTSRETNRVVYRGADAPSANLVLAFQASHAAAMETVRHLLSGHTDLAQLSAERANACEYAYRLASRQVERGRRQHQRTGRWRDHDRYGIRLDGVRFQFEFAAYWDVKGGSLEVDDTQALEATAGLQAAPAAWRQLLALLLRFETGKPGPPADPAHLIWKSVGTELVLRSHVQRDFGLVTGALEVLRRTLRPVLQDEGPPDTLDRRDVSEPDWVHDATDVHAGPTVTAVQNAADTLARTIRPVTRPPRRRRT